MIILRTLEEMQEFSRKAKREGKTIGLVPTMGYLHDGHASLIRLMRENADAVITTLFVNPTQFAPNEDLSRYPRDFDRDVALASANGSNVLFAPDASEMYPSGYATSVSVGIITQKFEGAFRPTHFDGVATVVAKLFNATLPDIAAFGQKDFQQSLVIRRLVADLNFGIRIIVAPTIREADGLAMSSRNVYLSPDEREKATILYRALCKAKTAVENGERKKSALDAILHTTLGEISELTIDYAAAANADTLEEPEVFALHERIVFLIALRLGKTRLIDNMTT